MSMKIESEIAAKFVFSGSGAAGMLVSYAALMLFVGPLGISFLTRDFCELQKCVRW